MKKTYSVANFYKFFDVLGSARVGEAGRVGSAEQTLCEELPAESIAQEGAAQLTAALDRIAEILEQRGELLGLSGLIIMAPEGLNGTIAGAADAVVKYQAFLKSFFSETEFCYKDGTCDKAPFKHFRVKVRSEIVTTGAKTPAPVDPDLNKLSPDDWHQMLQRDDIIVVDVRNTYETALGMFDKAIDPQTENFQEFQEFVESADWPRDTTMLMYCTGGIRCEKAIGEVQKLGYQSVYQLDGGILNYLKKYPEGAFRGECFVFDNRVAVDAQLNPTERYAFCPHCGQPGDIVRDCARCDRPAKICASCERTEHLRTCSKDCAYHAKRLSIGPASRLG